jgi:hypothetical protein
MKYILGLALLLLVAACDNKVVAPPNAPATPTQRPAHKPAGASTSTDTPKDQPTGPSLLSEFRKEREAAFTAWKQWGEQKTAEAYANAGTHIYRAMTVMKRHELNKQSMSQLGDTRKLKELMIDFKKSHGSAPKGWDSDPEYKQAFEDYNSLND